MAKPMKAADFIKEVEDMVNELPLEVQVPALKWLAGVFGGDFPIHTQKEKAK